MPGAVAHDFNLNNRGKVRWISEFQVTSKPARATQRNLVLKNQIHRKLQEQKNKAKDT